MKLRGTKLYGTGCVKSPGLVRDHTGLFYTICQEEPEMNKWLFFVLLSLLLVSCTKKDQEIKSESPGEIHFPKDTYEGVQRLFKHFECPVEYSTLDRELDKTSFEEWSNFKTVITEGSKKEVNYGGRFILISWGCGTECMTGAVIDASTGVIYGLPTAEWGYEYKKESLLLIVNPPSDDDGEYGRPDYAYPAYYVWSGSGFELLHDTRE